MLVLGRIIGVVGMSEWMEGTYRVLQSSTCVELCRLSRHTAGFAMTVHLVIVLGGFAAG